MFSLLRRSKKDFFFFFFSAPRPDQADNMESLLLSVKLQDCYNATSVAGQDDLNIYCPSIGQACVACYDDKLWYRAQVMGEGTCMYALIRVLFYSWVFFISVFYVHESLIQRVH